MNEKNKNGKVPCPNCKTGKESYIIDPGSFTCPYLCCLIENECAYYVPINEEEDE